MRKAPISVLAAHAMPPASRSATFAVRTAPLLRCYCSKGGGVAKPTDDALAEAPRGKGGADVKVWSGNVELPAVTKKEAEESYLDATSVSRAITPPTALATEARNDMTKDRVNYVSTNLRPEAQYIVPGKSGAVAPVAVSQGALGMASLIVLCGGLLGAVYIKKEWKVSSAKELGDALRARGAARREAIEASSATSLVRSISQTADTTVKENVELLRRPSQQLGSHFNESFQGKIVKKKPE